MRKMRISRRELFRRGGVLGTLAGPAVTVAADSHGIHGSTLRRGR